MGHIHWTADYRRRRRLLLATVTPDSRCRRCGKTIDQHKPHGNGRPAYWQAGHLVDGDPNSPLALEASTCNLAAGGRLGAARLMQRREPVSPNA
jgi:hypothetical protein